MAEKLPADQGAANILARVRAARLSKKTEEPAVATAEVLPANPSDNTELKTPSFLKSIPEEEAVPGKPKTNSFFSDVKTKKEDPFLWEKEKVKTPTAEKKSVETSLSSKPEDKAQEKLNQTFNDLTAKVAQIEDIKKKKSGKFESLGKLLKINARSLENDEEIIALQKESEALYRSLMIKGILLYKDDKTQLDNFISQYGNKEKFYLNLTNEVQNTRIKNAGFPEKAVNYFYKAGKKWSELKKWQQIAIGAAGGLATAGGALAVGVGTFGAVALTAGYRYGFRGFGAMAMGVGRKISLEKKRGQEKGEEWKSQFNKQMEFIEQYGQDLHTGIDLIINKKTFADIGKDYEEVSLQNTRQALKLAGKTALISTLVGETFRIVGQETGINIGSVFRKIDEYTGLSKAMGSFAWPWQLHAGGGFAGQQANEVLYTQGPGGKMIIAPQGAEATGGSPIKHFDGGPKIPDDQLGQLQKMAATADAQAKAQAMSEFAKSPATGADVNLPEGLKTQPLVPEPEMRTGGAAGAYPEGKYGPAGYGTEGEGSEDIAKSINERHGYGKYGEAGYNTEGDGHVAEAEVNAPEIAKPKNILLGFDDIKKGGGIEKSAQAIIKADPEQFGLDPKDPRLNAKIGQKAHVLARGLAKSLGFEGNEGYEEFNKIASEHVQKGDQIRLFKDPITGKHSMEYSGDAFGDSSVSENVPEAEMSAPKVASPNPAEPGASRAPASSRSSGQIAPEDLKPKAGIAEQPPRSAAQMQAGAEVGARPNVPQEAAVPSAEQTDAQMEAVNEAANARLYLSTRGLVKEAFHKAGISRHLNIFDQPMSEWENLLQTQRRSLETAKLAKLEGLYKLLKDYEKNGFETIGDCLREAVKNSANMVYINRLDLAN